ncbi:hypothetical protein BV25DRAFT_486075 [Artomyces pyxidatus]|uniref:Uncharacterized protein n=1 Tax=Artomyces pyxidatus TaxID=48021 RepID=A0ACB8T382_9AGAM|nr:hypothetical protein BV25DRAFT_486075 [Artomyces pyxidatus]
MAPERSSDSLFLFQFFRSVYYQETANIWLSLAHVFEHGTLYTGLATALVLVLVTRYIRSPWRKVPPGPRGLPIVGNVQNV